MKISHLHLAFTDYASAVTFFREVLRAEITESTAEYSVVALADSELVLHPDWGHGDTTMTLALQSEHCERDYQALVQRGAKPRKPPFDKGPSINADVFGPGKLVIELEQWKG